MYQNDRPLYHLDSARSLAYDPNDPGVSSIFVTDAAEFKKMAPKNIQDVLRYRHILVTGHDTENMQFNLEGLATLGSLSQVRDMQGKSNVTHLDTQHTIMDFQLQDFKW